MKYNIEDVGHLSENTGIDVVKYQNLIYLIEFDLEDLTDEIKLKVYSDFVRSEYYQEHDEGFEGEGITNLLYICLNKEDGVVEYDVVTEEFDILNTDWIYVS